MNSHEQAARYRKANALVIALRNAGIPAADVARMDRDQWGMAAQGAGVNAPSAATVALVLDMMEKLEATRPASSYAGDPFAGLEAA